MQQCPIETSSDSNHKEAKMKSSKDNRPEKKRPAPPAARLSEEMIDETLAESFPTSDPPSWTTGRDPHAEQTAGNDPSHLSNEELKHKAAELNIHGRNSMNREQLIVAIRGQLSRTRT